MKWRNCIICGEEIISDNEKHANNMKCIEALAKKAQNLEERLERLENPQ